jgi:hypothetical protein
MLPLPRLDDRTFEELVREARDLIPILAPDWTDENVHDPGITLLEMLAWHIETQQYRLDRLTERHLRKFLKLLGELPRERTPAMTSVSFSNATSPIVIPYGTLLHVGDLPFETIRSVTVLPDTGRKVFVRTPEGVQEITDDFESGHAPFHPFGEHPEIGACMDIHLEEPLPFSVPLSLWIQLEDQEPDIRIPARYRQFTPSGQVTWQYWDEREGTWRILPVERDESYSLHQSGPVLFEVPPELGPIRRLRAELTAGGYNDPPLIRRLVWNEVFAMQGQSLCVCEAFDGPSAPGGGDGPELAAPYIVEPAHALFRKGRLIVQFRRRDGGWTDAGEETYDIARDGGRLRIVFPDPSPLPTGRESIRVIAVAKEFVERMTLGTGTGISGQTFPLPAAPVLPRHCLLQVGETADDGTIVWRDWERVPDFDASKEDSLHYMIDEEAGVFRFSDGVSGAVPPAMPFPNVRLISYRIGVGEAGNVKEDTIREIDIGEQPLRVTNLYPAYGGAEPETVREALQRLKRRMLQPQCGVTGEDLEQRVREIPGLRIARVKAIPGYHPGIRNWPEERAFGHLSIVIVPRSRRPLPLPGEGMIRTIRRHLEPYRLITTRLHVIPPEYVKVSVRAVVVADPRYEGREWTVVQALKEWLQPFGNGSSPGWIFGRPVYKSDVYEIIHRVPGVRYIQDVWLMAEGQNARLEESGDIRIPPNGLVISGEHDIEFVISHD